MSNKLDIELKQGEDFYKLQTIKSGVATFLNTLG